MNKRLIFTFEYLCILLSNIAYFMNYQSFCSLFIISFFFSSVKSCLNFGTFGGTSKVIILFLFFTFVVRTFELHSIYHKLRSITYGIAYFVQKLPLPFELWKRGVASKCFVFFIECRVGRYRRQ